MHPKEVILPHRLRQIPQKFNWLDHRLVRNDYLSCLSPESCTLYLFLLTVSDREGLSYYSDRRICELTPLRELISCREDLIQADLLAYSGGMYQVLSLPFGQKVSQATQNRPKDQVPWNQQAKSPTRSLQNQKPRHAPEVLKAYLEKLR